MSAFIHFDLINTHTEEEESGRLVFLGNGCLCIFGATQSVLRVTLFSSCHEGSLKVIIHTHMCFLFFELYRNI